MVTTDGGQRDAPTTAMHPRFPPLAASGELTFCLTIFVLFSVVPFLGQLNLWPVMKIFITTIIVPAADSSLLMAVDDDDDDEGFMAVAELQIEFAVCVR